MSDEIGKGIWDIANKQMKTESIAKESFFTDLFNNPEIVEKANKLINELE